MPKEIFHDSTFVMKKGYPKVTKLGAVSPNGECSPFVFNGRVYRMESVWHADRNQPKHTIIRDRETGEIVLIRNRFSGARTPARLPVRVRTQTG